MINNQKQGYYQAFAELCEELNIQSYTDELYAMFADNPSYFELIFPGGQHRQKLTRTDSLRVKPTSERIAS